MVKLIIRQNVTKAKNSVSSIMYIFTISKNLKNQNFLTIVFIINNCINGDIIEKIFFKLI